MMYILYLHVLITGLFSCTDTVKIVDTINTALKCSEDLEGREEEAAIDAIGRIGMCALSLCIFT